MFIIIFIVLSFIIISCDSTEKKFNDAWEQNDSLYVKEFIKNLKHEKIENLTAICFSVLSEKTNFCYGILYFPEDKTYWGKVSDNKKEIIKQNILDVWNLYAESKLFMNKKCKGFLLVNGEEKTFHEVYYPDRDKIFNQSELDEIRMKMDSIGGLCLH